MGALPMVSLGSISRISNRLAPVKPSWLIELIHLNDANVESQKKVQIIDPTLASFGCFLDWEELPSPQGTAGFISNAACAVSCPESVFYRSVDLLRSVDNAIQYLLNIQHKDGTIDLLGTNFHSTPDTGFSVEKLTTAFVFIKTLPSDISAKVIAKLSTYLKNAGEALISGGIHTPNHRWVVSAALSKLNKLWPNERYVNRANQWLGEHIDLDAEGQYTEKSTGGYTTMVDRLLIIIANNFNKPEILEYVRKNLNMTMYYVHPNGEVVTEASNRQDKGTIGSMDGYYYSYRYLALLDKNGEYATMCKQIEKRGFSNLLGSLDNFLENSFLWNELPNNLPVPISYAKAFPLSGVARIRRNHWDATILSNNAAWLTFHKGDAVLQGMRVAASFFGKGQFQSSKINKNGEVWELYNKIEGVYYQPYPKEGIDPNGDLSKMPKTNRPKSEIQQLESIIRITETATGLSVDIDIRGTEGVPVTVELAFRKGGVFAGLQPQTASVNNFLIKDTFGSYTQGKDTIHFGPGRIEHKAFHLRGALPPLDAPSAYLTGFTPFKHTILLS